MSIRSVTRIWRAYADRAHSEAARSLKVMIPMAIIGFVIRLTAPEPLAKIIGIPLVEVSCGARSSGLYANATRPAPSLLL